MWIRIKTIAIWIAASLEYLTRTRLQANVLWCTQSLLQTPVTAPFQRPCSLQHCTLACSVRKYTVLKSRSALATRDAKHKSVQMNYNPFRQPDTTTTTFLFLKRMQQLFFEIRWHSIFQGNNCFVINFSWLSLFLLIVLWDTETFYSWCNKCFLINFLAPSF